MRDLIKNSTEMKLIASVFFAGEIITYTLMAPFFGIDNISLGLIWQMLIISIILTGLQYLIYTSNFLFKIKTCTKIFIHYVILVIMGYLWAMYFNWFDVGSIKNIGISLVIFTAWFLAFTWSISIYNKATGEQFNEKLKIYKSSKEKL
ncbi:MAG: hypothetical protein RR636_05020 [Clostridium sp.]|uniref:hypothetical protein n=1 Tax=Clostridium sp. TaxID=1506 RepID=UPI0030533AE4